MMMIDDDAMRHHDDYDDDKCWCIDHVDVDDDNLSNNVFRRLATRSMRVHLTESFNRRTDGRIALSWNSLTFKRLVQSQNFNVNSKKKKNMEQVNE